MDHFKHISYLGPTIIPCLPGITLCMFAYLVLLGSIVRVEHRVQYRVQYSAAQYSTQSTEQYSTVQCNFKKVQLGQRSVCIMSSNGLGEHYGVLPNYHYLIFVGFAQKYQKYSKVQKE